MADEIAQEPKLLPTLMRDFQTDEDLDQYVIDHAYMFTVITPRPGGFQAGYGANYDREEVHIENGDWKVGLEKAMARAEEIHGETKKTILIYAVADFAGARGFSRPVRQFPLATYRSKADKARDEVRARAAKRAERQLKKDVKKAKASKAS